MTDMDWMLADPIHGGPPEQQRRGDCGSAALRASRPTHLTASVGTIDTVTERTLSGMGLPFGEVGQTSIGPVEVDPAVVLDYPDDLTDVVLVDEHQDPPAPIGYLTATRRTDAGERMSFHVAEIPEGDRALVLAGQRVKRGFSVELDDLQYNTAGRLVRATVVRVAHVVTPAFASARHDGMAASHNTTNGDTPMTDEQRARLAELLATPEDQLTDDTRAERDQLIGAASADDMTAVTQLVISNAASSDTGTDTGTDTPGDTGTADAGQQLAAARQGTAATVPGSIGSGTPARRTARSRPIRELYAAQSRVLSGRSRPHMEAALSDITMTGNIWTMQDAYAGELWSGLQYQRRFVQNSTPDTLSALKGTGWRWVVKPAVADYAGDKAAVPSNVPTTEDTEWTAGRLAGAHDMDRAHFDFGNTEFIEGYYRAMRESYAVQSDDKARAFQLASATAVAGAETSLFRAVAVAAQAVEDNTLGAPVDWIYVNSADRLNLLDVSAGDLPAYLEVFGITPEKFQAVPGVPAGTVVAGSKQATKFRELSETPIRVEAINVANGGIDGGVFGYYATELVFPGGIASKTFA